MATTTSYSGSLRSEVSITAALSGDKSGSEVAKDGILATFSAAGGSAPTVSGFLKGTATLAGVVTLLLAHATDPLQGAGDAAYSEGFAPAGAKLKLLRIRNTDPTNSIVVSRPANGLPIFEASGDAVTLAPGDQMEIYRKAGTAALTTGTNDALTLTPSAGSPTAEIVVVYGP